MGQTGTPTDATPHFSMLSRPQGVGRASPGTRNTASAVCSVPPRKLWGHRLITLVMPRSGCEAGARPQSSQPGWRGGERTAEDVGGERGH